MDKKLRTNLILNIAYHVLVIFVPFITAPYLGRILGPEQIGLYTYLHSIVTYFSHFAMLGLSNYGNREIAKVRYNRDLRSKRFCEIYSMQLITSGISLIIYLIYVFSNKADYTFISAIMILWVASNLFDIGWYCMGMEQFKTVVLRNVIIKILTVVLIFIFVKSEKDINKYVFIMSGGQLLSQMILWNIAKREIDFILPRWVEIIKHIKPNVLLFLPAIAASIYQIMDKIMIGHMSSKSELAYYEYADKLIQIPLLVFTAMGTVMLSRMSNLQGDKDKSGYSLIGLSMDLSMLLATVSSFGLASISHELINIYYGISFARSSMILILLCPVIFMNGWANVLRMQYVIPRNKDTVYIKATVGGAVVNLICNAIFIPRFYAIGATIGTIAAQTIVAVIFSYYSRQELPLKTYIKSNIPYFFIGIVMFVAVKGIQRLHVECVGGLIIDILVGAFTFIVLSLIICHRTPNHLVSIIDHKVRKLM